MSEVCLLGFNKGKGMEISLRLRTDDMKGFRQYATIMRTLLHELAHMVWSEHDNNFKELNSELTREYHAKSWDSSSNSGYRLGSGSYSRQEEEDDPDDVMAQAKAWSGSRVGTGPADILLHGMDPGNAAAFAALGRLQGSASSNPPDPKTTNDVESTEGLAFLPSQTP